VPAAAPHGPWCSARPVSYIMATHYIHEECDPERCDACHDQASGRHQEREPDAAAGHDRCRSDRCQRRCVAYLRVGTQASANVLRVRTAVQSTGCAADAAARRRRESGDGRFFGCTRRADSARRCRERCALQARMRRSRRRSLKLRACGGQRRAGRSGVADATGLTNPTV